MKTKKLTPRNVAPVKRNTLATASGKPSSGGDISPLIAEAKNYSPDEVAFLESILGETLPFAGDDAE